MTKNRLSAFFASLFFSVTAVGLDTTNWVFNMPTYVTISLFFSSLYFFISSREKGIRRLLIAALLYYFAYITAPIRMHGSLPFILLIELFWLFQNRDIKTLKKVLLRFGVMFFVFLIIKFTGPSLGPASEISERFNLGIKGALQLLSQGRFDFLFYPILMIGSMIIPDLLLTTTSVISYKQLVGVIVPIVLVSLTITYFVLRSLNKSTKTVLTNISLALIFWTFIVTFIHRENVNSFNNNVLIILLLIGGYLITFSISCIILFYSQKNTINLIFISLSWMLLSFFFAWWWVPTSIFPSTYRYLIVSAAGLSILLSTYISLGSNLKKQVSLFILFCLLISFHIYSTRLYLDYNNQTHGQHISNRIWATMPIVPEINKSKEAFIFYFEGDETNSVILHDVITFGFPPHMALIYNLREGDPIPVPMNNFSELVAAVTDGKPMPAYGYKAEPVDINRVYAFHLKGSNNLIDITKNVREKLKQLTNQQL